jgi:hypothetical protein
MNDAERHHEEVRAAYLDAREELVDVLIRRISTAIRGRMPDATQIDLGAHLLDDGRASLEAVAIHRAGLSIAQDFEPQDLINAEIRPFLDELGELLPSDDPTHIVL